MANFTSILTGKQVESLLANYATCTTAGSTAAKVATISSINGATPQFELFTGLTVRVKFTNSNTAANPTLDVNSTGAKAIKRYGTTAPGTAAKTSWSAGAIVSLTYDGSYWVMNDIKDDQYIGDITGVTAGNGLTGGGTSGDVTLNVGAGNGISVAADTVSAKAGSGITVDANGINANTSFTTSGKNYKVQVDSTSGGLFVNVPWQDNNTTYTAGEGIKIASNQISAKEHTHTASYTPAGTVSQPTFTGNTVTSAEASSTKAVASSEHTHSVTPEGTVDLDISEVTSGGNYQPKGTISGSFTGTAHNHTFTGTAATSTKPDTTNVSTIYSITGVGSAPSLTKTNTSPSKITEWSAGTLPNLTTKSEEVSLISSWSEGTLPTTTNITYVSGGSKTAVLTGVTHSGTTSVATGVTQGSGALVSYSEDANTNSEVKYDSNDFIPVIHDITTNTTQVSTGAKATSTGTAAPNEHTHTYTKATGVNLGSNTTASNGVQYIESISSTAASASNTANVGSGTHTHSHTPKGSVSIGVSADEVAGTYRVVTDISGGDVSTSTANAAPNEHTHDITIAGTTSTNSGTAVKAVTAVGADGTVTVLTGVKASSSEDFLVSLNNGSGSLTSNTTSTDGITYVESVTHSAASLTGTKTFNTDAIKNVTLSASTTSTDGPKYIEDVSHTAASLTGTTTFNTDAIKKVAITASETRVDGDTQYVHSVTGDAPTLTGTTTFIKSISGGSGSLVAYDASSGGNAKTTNGNRIPYVSSLSKSGYTPAGSVTLSNGTAPSMNFDTGTNTDTPYISSISGGSAVSKTTKYMKFSAGTTPVSSASFTGSAVTSGGASTTNTTSAGANTSTTSNTGSGGGGTANQATSASTTLSNASVSAGVLTITKSNHTHNYTKPASHTHTYYAPVAHTHTLSHTHSVTAAGTISLTRGTAPSMNFDTGSSSDIPYISSISGGSAVSATTKYMKFSAGTTPKASASFSGTKSTAVVTGGTTYYLDHGHTAASGSTGTVGISGGIYTGNEWGLTLTTENASTGTVGISGGSISKTTRYMKRTTTAAGTGTVGISGGSISPVTKYLHHTHTPTTAGITSSAVTGVASNGTATVLTGVKATSTANVAPSGHTHSYGGSTALTTTANSGTSIPAVTEVTYEAPTYTKQALQATFTGTASNTGGPSATTSVVTGVTGGTASATKKYFHPTITTESANTGKNSGTGITAVTGVGNNGLVDVISTVTSDQGWLKHTHTSAKASGTATAITGVKSNGTVNAYTSLDTASAKAVNTVGSLPSLDYTDSTILVQDSWSAGTLPTLEYTTETSTKIDSWSAGSTPTRSSAISVPNANHTHNVTATGTIENTTAGGTVSATFTGKQVLIEPTFTGKSVSTELPNHTIKVASSDHTHTVKATGTVSKPSFTGTAATISSNGASYEEDN